MSIAMNEASSLRPDVAQAAHSQEPEAALVDAARRSDQEAFNELMTRYSPRIFRLAMRITRNREDAEEVSQDSFARAFTHIGTFRGDSRFSTWLTRIAINQSLMKLRTHRMREFYLDPPINTEGGPLYAEVPDGTPTPEQRYSQEELRRILASVMDELPTRFRAVLYLREVEEHSLEETATILGLSVSIVKSRVHRGRHKLRQALARRYSGKNLGRFSGRNVV